MDLNQRNMILPNIWWDISCIWFLNLKAIKSIVLHLGIVKSSRMIWKKEVKTLSFNTVSVLHLTLLPIIWSFYSRVIEGLLSVFYYSRSGLQSQCQFVKLFTSVIEMHVQMRDALCSLIMRGQCMMIYSTCGVKLHALPWMMC